MGRHPLGFEVNGATHRHSGPGRPAPPSPSNAARQGQAAAFDREAYKQRSTVGRCVNRLKQWRGIATRYEKTATLCPSRAPLPLARPVIRTSRREGGVGTAAVDRQIRRLLLFTPLVAVPRESGLGLVDVLRGLVVLHLVPRWR
ncbi:hypothetical protein CG723_40450 [Streptomyces sp. CB01635]|nr:hypothetical protein CG723_40450 [Streptomyces sp. CB01635]